MRQQVLYAENQEGTYASNALLLCSICSMQLLLQLHAVRIHTHVRSLAKPEDVGNCYGRVGPNESAPAHLRLSMTRPCMGTSGQTVADRVCWEWSRGGSLTIWWCLAIWC